MASSWPLSPVYVKPPDWRLPVFGVESRVAGVQPPRRMHILFDLDGTLVDSRPGIFNSIQYSLKHHELPVPAAEDLLWCIGPPILESFAKLVGPDSPHLFEPAVEKYRERYSATGIFECEVFPEIVETLAELQRQRHTMHVATSKAEVYAKRIITHFEMDRFFASVNGSELDGTRANKAELIAHILEQQGISREEVVMIGDREHDMIGAVKNSVPAIGALWGYGTGKELMESGATLCSRVPHLLVEMVETF
jgi:phosphoglycolate phosphatase